MRWKLKPGNCALQSPTLGDIKKAPIRGCFVTCVFRRGKK